MAVEEAQMVSASHRERAPPLTSKHELAAHPWYHLLDRVCCFPAPFSGQRLLGPATIVLLE